MSQVMIFWDPQGLTVDSLGNKEYLRATDGDTPYVSVSVRMLSIDAPETHYPGNAKPANSDLNLAQLGQWIYEGRAPVDDGLAAYLHPRLIHGKAGTLQGEQGARATDVFKQLLDKRLTKPNGGRRSLFIRTSGTQFDSYGRVLAYIAPSFNSKERAQLSPWEQATFNLLMVRSGWAAPFVIYPSIPKYPDLLMFHQAAKEAYLTGRGIWEETLMLAGYEFRMAVKLFKITEKLLQGESLSQGERMRYVTRYCVDMTTREIYFPDQYYRVAPYNRLFIWPDDVKQAVGDLNLSPPSTE